MRILIDTNVLISAILFPGSLPSRVVEIVISEHTLILSPGIIDEAIEVFRRKFPTRVPDLEQFFRILPDRRPGTGPLSTPSTATATAFRPVGQAVNVLLGANLASLVIELPTAQLTAGGNAKIGLWGTISR